MTPPIYIISYKNPSRRARMNARFAAFDITPIYPVEVHIDDSRIDPNISPDSARVFAVMWQHLDAVRHFYEKTTDSFAIICEDDIHISRFFEEDVENAQSAMDEYNLDCLMLGYLLPFKLNFETVEHLNHFEVIGRIGERIICRYPNDIWGSQMYMITRSYAKYALDTFTKDYRGEFNPDWTLTKNGNRALVYPMVAVEEGENMSSDVYHKAFHKQCHQVQFDAAKYL